MCEGFALMPADLRYITEFPDRYRKEYKLFYRARAPVLFMPKNFTTTKPL